jgi:hypothetical protein
MNIFDKLKFTEIELGKVQSVGDMTIIPILGTPRIDKNKIAKPENLHFSSIRGYGNMEFENEDQNFGLMPSNLMVISEELAQDHCMNDTVILEGKEKKSWKNACCVQETQAGMLSGDKKQSSFNVMPLELRKKLLTSSMRKKESFGKLWNDISKWLENIPQVKSNAAHIEYFFRPYKKELEDFVAEFEPVENQIGSLVYFGSQCVGMEIMPNEDYWNYYWKWIIRGCYGAELKRMKLLGKAPQTKVQLPKLKTKSDKLEANIDKYINAVKNVLVKNMPMIDGVESYQNKVGGKVTYDVIDTPKAKGDLVSYENKYIYSSIVF